MEKSGAKAYLVNTGWNGTGKRISIRDTRGIIDAILSGAINEAPTKTIPYFNFEVPTELPGVIRLSWILAIPMLMLPSGRPKHWIWLKDSSRTLQNMKETLLVKHLFPLVRRNKFSELTERKPLT